ncbi:hypothetical protein MNBD_GAMMA26-550 [hydrothermal vent metagenome]|uniref:Hydrogenase iron-sulfur subunit n=1 Tax=hydrothermal vent metagenome TaxID=652676 RepID=A0A3B1AQV2_9ZZZZ
MKSSANPIKRLYLYLEEWFTVSFGEAWNPLYHLGPLTFFFFWIIFVTGFYLFIFFNTTVAHAHESLEVITNEHLIGGIIRSLHRYASDAAIITITLHIFREFSQDRYRGTRWYSWFTGIPTLWMIVLFGITGYWMVWDELALYIAMGSAHLLDAMPIFSDSMARNFLPGNLSDRFSTLLAFMHLLGQPMFLVFMIWFHVRRLTHVEISAPRGLAIGCFMALVALSIYKPAVSHQIADLSKVPVELHIDWFYLNIFPLLKYWSPGEIWALVGGVTVFMLCMPWMPRKHEGAVAVVDLDHCNGCGQCVIDCPFDAISVQPRTDGAKWDSEVIVHPELCSACGICIGSCPSSNPFRKVKDEAGLKTGIDMPDMTLDRFKQQTDEVLAELKGDQKIVIFGCKNCYDIRAFGAPDVGILQFFCTGMMPASLAEYALKNGADGVVVSGCRHGDCFYRFGNHWMDLRLKGERQPALRQRVDHQRIKVLGGAITDGRRLKRQLQEFRDSLPGQQGIPSTAAAKEADHE